MAGKAISLISPCSLLMACLFALSASFQLDDPDWYLWFPLYTCGCIVNLVNGVGKSPKPIIRSSAQFALWLGLFLCIKVVFEDLQNGGSGFWSLDMRERVVREKIGSGLVIGSMSLELKAQASRGQKQKSAKHFEYGNDRELKKLLQQYISPLSTNVANEDFLVWTGKAILVGFGYGLTLAFYLYHKKEMKF